MQDVDKQLSNVLQSDEKYSGDNSVIHVRLFGGYSGSGYKKLLHKSEITAGKKCIIQIKNDDNRCMIRAIAIGQAINSNDPQLKSIKDLRIKLQLNTGWQLYSVTNKKLNFFMSL